MGESVSPASGFDLADWIGETLPGTVNNPASDAIANTSIHASLVNGESSLVNGFARKHPILNKWYLRVPEGAATAAGVIALRRFFDDMGQHRVSENGDFTPERAAAIAAARVNQSESAALAMWRRGQSSGKLSYQQGQFYLVAKLGPVADATRAWNARRNGESSFNDFSEWLLMAPAFAASGQAPAAALGPTVAVALLSPQMWQAWYGQWQFFVNAKRETEAWRISAGPLQFSLPESTAFLAVHDRVVGMHEAVLWPNKRLSAEVGVDVGLDTRRTRVELLSSSLPLTSWLSVAPYGAIDVGGGRSVGETAGISIGVSLFQWLTKPSLLHRLRLSVTPEWSHEDLMHQDVGGQSNGLHVMFGVGLNSKPATAKAPKPDDPESPT